jgi:hypothetical protein
MPKSLKQQRAEFDAVVASFVRVPNTVHYRSEQYPGCMVGETLGTQPYAVFRDGKRFAVATAFTFDGAVAIAINLTEES